VNWAHLKTFVWLRWRLTVNQIRRSGAVGEVISVLFTALIVAGGVVTLLAAFVLGYLGLSTADPTTLMIIWDGAIVGFLFFWMIGLVSELQHSDALSLDRFLHLPVSPSGAFLINYVGSSFSLALVIFLPAMTGLAIGLTLSRGASMLLLFPLVAAFFLMMTAITHQFRGWLASMMENPRRRRTIAALVPLLFVLMSQLPNLWMNVGPGATQRREAREETRRERAALDKDLSDGRISREEYNARRRSRPPARTSAFGVDTVRIVNEIVPPGWLAYGAEATASGRAWPPLAAVLGMSLIGALSLRRAYGTTIRMYKGDFDGGGRMPTPAAAPAPPSSSVSGGMPAFLERRLPWMSERASAVAVAGVRSWMRAPEMKMTLLTPVFMLVAFTGLFVSQGGAATPLLLRPLNAAGLAGFLMVLTLAGPAGNQFGYDRAGFRAFVLSPIPRRDVLIGKNVGLLPLGLLMMVIVISVSEWFRPMRVDHFVAVLIQTVPMYLLFCMAANVLSIVGPLTLKTGSGMPARHQGIRGFYPVIFMLGASLLLGFTFIPLGIEALLSLTSFAWFPAYLVLGLLQAIASIWLYRVVLEREGVMLQRQEQDILAIVGGRTE
jgi:ABC-2 type transport system permease protein